MAEEKEKSEKKLEEKPEEHEVLVRIIGYDIPGSKNIYTGLIRIKGISWTISNAVCHKLKIPKTKKISELSKEDIKKIEDFLNKLPISNFLKNRRSDPETGENSHYYGHDLDMKKEFDIKRLRKIKSYKGVRHAAGLPVRGQRTRAHFRAKGKAVGVKVKSTQAKEKSTGAKIKK